MCTPNASSLAGGHQSATRYCCKRRRSGIQFDTIRIRIGLGANLHKSTNRHLYGNHARGRRSHAATGREYSPWTEVR